MSTKQFYRFKHNSKDYHKQVLLLDAQTVWRIARQLLITRGGKCGFRMENGRKVTIRTRKARFHL